MTDGGRSATATRRWWLGDVAVIAAAALVLVLSMVLSPSTEMLTLFGQDIPVLCGFRRLTGVGCPGCGLTRSFVFLGHGQVWSAFQMNWLGPPLFVAVFLQIPLRLYRMATRLRRSG